MNDILTVKNLSVRFGRDTVLSDINFSVYEGDYIGIVGTMLISNMIILPTVSALWISKGFKSTMPISAVISLVCVILGIFISFILNFPSGATIVIVNAICFTICFTFNKRGKA